MIAYIVRRTLLAGFSLLVISFISYVIVQIPEGDVFDSWYANYVMEFSNEPPDEEEIQLKREELNLYDPFVVQWWKWIWGVISRGDFGKSYTELIGRNVNGTPVVRIIEDRLPFTILLSIFTVVVVWIFSIPVGIYSAVRQHSIGDYVFTFIGFTGLAVPDFLLGLVLMYVFFAYFDHKVGGLFDYDYRNAAWSVGRVLNLLQHLIIPGIVMGTAGTAGLIRVMRNNLLDELKKPYVVTAHAKGLPAWRVIAKYPVRVAFNPFISGIGSMLPGLLGADAIVSIVLGLPTMGPIMLQATLEQDGHVVAALMLMYSSLAIVGVLISDLMLVVVDPRIKLTGSARGSTSGAV